MDYSLPLPKRTVQETDRILSAPGSPFEWEEKRIGTRTVRVYKNLPPSIRDYWLQAASPFADKEYIVYERERLTYADTHRRVLHLASLLHARGVRKGDRVAIAMRNTPEWIISWWACHMLGGIAVAVNAWLPSSAFLHCISITEATAVLVDSERQDLLGEEGVGRLRGQGTKAVFVVRTKEAKSGFERLDEALEGHKVQELPKIDINDEDPATIFFTSGTTSLPKGVLSTQRQYLSNRWNTAVGAARAFLRKGEDIPAPDPSLPQRSLLLTVPLFHVMGNQSFLALLTAVGGKIVLMHKFVPSLAASLVLSETILSIGGIPNIVSQILDELDGLNVWDRVKLEGLSYGGGPPSSRLPMESKKRLPNASAAQGYGLSEVNSVATGFAGDDYIMRPTSCGLPPPVVQLRIIDPSAPQPASAAPSLPTGSIGEVCIFGPNVAEGYWRDEESTRKAFDKEGWFRSGDLGYVDDEGFLYIADRAKDIIIRSGENISSVVVEDALFQHDAVKEVAVVAVPCEKHGEQVAAVIVLHPPSHPSRTSSSLPPPTESSLQSLVASRLPKHCIPAMILFPAEYDTQEGLPKNATGKVLKNEVKKVAGREWVRRGLGKMAGVAKAKAKL
ncbi:hypothetical protein JCM10295v2_001275 [Rhodotorula toruloides]